jgi:hypothetical protein
MDASDLTKQKLKIVTYKSYITAVKRAQPACLTGTCVQLQNTCVVNYPDYATKEAVTTGFAIALSNGTC